MFRCGRSGGNGVPVLGRVAGRGRGVRLVPPAQAWVDKEQVWMDKDGAAREGRYEAMVMAVEREAMLRTVDLLERVDKIQQDEGEVSSMMTIIDYLLDEYDHAGPDMFVLVLYNLVISHLALIENILPLLGVRKGEMSVAAYLEGVRQKVLDLAVEVEGQ